MPRVSVVLPVYNVERYLAACLDSLRSQSLRDIEIICVDDGSTDRSPMLLEMAAATDSRISIITKPNGGLSSARNVGLAAATGDYVMFVDSDDFLHRRACETVVKTFAKTQAEIVTFGAYIHPSAHATRWLTKTLSPRKKVFEAFEPDLLFKEAARPFVWRSAFTRMFLEREGLGFDETVPFGEDQVFYFAAYPLSRRTALIPKRLYYYRASRPHSLMASRFEDRREMLKEHQHIARVILDGWNDRGWLEQYRVPMLGWVLDFLAGEAASAPGNSGRQLRRSLAALLQEYFPAGPWLEATPPTARALLAALQEGESVGAAAKRRAMHIAWRGQREPVDTVGALLESAKGIWPVLRVRGVAWRVLPSSSRAEYLRFRELADNVNDEAHRAEAMQMLQMEWLVTLNGTDSARRETERQLATRKAIPS